MKKIYIVLILLFTGLSGLYSQTASQNYILTHTCTNDDGSTFLDQIQYFDGLGRAAQTVQKWFTPAKADLVTLQEYDGFGRDSIAWLPAVVTDNNGAYVAPATIKTKAVSNNAGDAKPYSYPVYEASPLNRVLQQFGPGADWQNNGKSVNTNYQTNSGTSGQLSCALFTVNGSGVSTKVYRNNFYGDAQLYVTKTTDEEGNISYLFKDKLDRVVLTRQILNGDNVDTYYIYDDFGNLCFVLPPLAVDGLANGTWDETNSSPVKLYAYIYRYDGRNRCIQKKLPGCNPIYYVYDRADHLIYTQDGEQRNKIPQEWTFSIPDALGRVVLTGTCKDTISISNKLVNGVFSTGGSYKAYTIQVDGANGAMTKDLNKGISDIQYNSLNLPRIMDIKTPVAEARNEYTYSASGQKLKVVQKWNPNYSTTPINGVGSVINTSSLTQSKTTEYIGNMIYENGALKRILIDGGYIDGSVYYYFQADHQGNNRLVVNANGTIVQTNHYYPFGMAFVENANYQQQGLQPYKYNGKELDLMSGLKQYDYGARYYDPAIARFTTMDPLCEKYYSISPYAYCANNPVNAVDMTGMDTTHVNRNGDVYVNLPGGKENIVVVDEPLPEVTVTATPPKSDAKRVLTGALSASGALIADDAVGGEMDDILIPFLFVGGAIIAGDIAIQDALTKPYPTAIAPSRSYNPPPKDLPGFPGSIKEKPKAGRPRWHLPDGKIGEWDSQEGEVEVYDKTGKEHQGAYDPKTGEKKKEGKPGRKTAPK